MPYNDHITSANDLRTSITDTKAGFVAMALEKSRQAIPHVQEARALAERIKDVDEPSELTLTRSAIIKNVANYVALGELKGGIDPAGADEHWKTARTALGRIREAFRSGGRVPDLFFVGAAIENSMAQEIWADLQAGNLSNAANLTKPKQIISLCKWLTEI